MLDDFDGINAPDKKAASGIDPITVVHEQFARWTSVLAGKNVFYDEGHLEDTLLDEAVRMLEGYDHLLPAVIDDKRYFAPIDDLWKAAYRLHAPLFYTALLAIGPGERRLIVPSCVPPLNRWGYKLKKGVLELYADGGDGIGAYADGGCIINHGRSLVVGNHARNGLFINKKSCSTLGQNTLGGIFVNDARSFVVGASAKGGTYINFSDIKPSVGICATGGLFIGGEEPTRMDAQTRALYLSDCLLGKDKVLRAELGKLESLLATNRVATWLRALLRLQPRYIDHHAVRQQADVVIKLVQDSYP